MAETIFAGPTFFFQAEDGIRDVLGSRGLGDVYKRQSNSFIKPLKISPMRPRSSENFIHDGIFHHANSYQNRT